MSITSDGARALAKPAALSFVVLVGGASTGHMVMVKPNPTSTSFRVSLVRSHDDGPIRIPVGTDDGQNADIGELTEADIAMLTRAMVAGPAIDDDFSAFYLDDDD